MLNSKKNISNKTIAYNGATVAVAAVFAYSMIVMIYTIIRSSATICSIMPTGERNTILLANGFSVAYSVAVFSLLMAILSAITGAIAAIILKETLQYFNPNFIQKKAIVISCITAFVTLIILYLLLHALLKDWMTFNYMETFSFWFLIPAIIYVGAYIITGIKLTKVLYTGIIYENKKI